METIENFHWDSDIIRATLGQCFQAVGYDLLVGYPQPAKSILWVMNKKILKCGIALCMLYVRTELGSKIYFLL